VRSALDGLPTEVADDVLLVVSELVTNALLHARTELELHVRTSCDSVFVAVRDANLDPPRRLEASALDAGGRGLCLVESLSDRWGVDEEPGGKVVWCELALAPVSGSERRPAPR
jgi:anti-sigma regulatory factor (Ser/Thr protein kinase)